MSSKHLIPFKGKKTSSSSNLNLLIRDKKIFIMDNHLAAGWCWLQVINLTNHYNLLHVDRHYDLLRSQIKYWVTALKKQKIDLQNISIDELIELKYFHPAFTGTGLQIFRWDNYLPLFYRLFPSVIKDSIFATHKDGDIFKKIVKQEVEAHDLVSNLSYWILRNSKSKWIVNLDVDYFFTDIDEIYIQLYTDEYIIRLAKEVKSALKNIEVLTIALSPEMCGGWENSIRVANLITEELQIKWSLPNDI